MELGSCGQSVVVGDDAVELVAQIECGGEVHGVEASQQGRFELCGTLEQGSGQGTESFPLQKAAKSMENFFCSGIMSLKDS